MFADIFEGVFCVDNGFTEFCRLIFGADRIDFSVQFLTQKIDFAARRFVVFDFGFERFQMTEQPDNLFVYRILYKHCRGFAHNALLVGLVAQEFVKTRNNQVFKKRFGFGNRLFKNRGAGFKRRKLKKYVFFKIFTLAFSSRAKLFKRVGKHRFDKRAVHIGIAVLTDGKNAFLRCDKRKGNLAAGTRNFGNFF